VVKSSDSQYILKVETAGLPDGLHNGNKTGDKDEAKVLG
jgi:hypothetical protein